MFEVTLHFPDVDYEGVQLRAIPRREDPFLWTDENGNRTDWIVSQVHSRATAGRPDLQSIGIFLDPENEW